MCTSLAHALGARWRACIGWSKKPHNFISVDPPCVLTLFFSARHAHFHYLDLRDARNRVHIPFSVFSNSTPSSLACSSNNLQKADGQSYSPLRRYFARPTSSDVSGSRVLCSSERWGTANLSTGAENLCQGVRPTLGESLWLDKSC